MFDHVTIRASDREASERFYGTVLETIGIEKTNYDEWDDFSLAPSDPENPVTRRLHVGFAAPSRDHVDEFRRVGTSAGYRDDGRPGPRPLYSEGYYGAFLLDPDGNSAEAVHHGSAHAGRIDHLRIRVADVAASKRFYEAVSPYTGFRLASEQPEFGHFKGTGASFSVLSGAPTEHVHMAFPAKHNETVDDYHGAAIQAGYRDNGPPGERTVYHAGYYGAYVLDPDGHNVEVVCHNRA